MSLQLLRKVIPGPVVNQLWQRGRAGTYPKKRSCPTCRRTMTEVPIQAKAGTEYVDVCSGCFFIWFDEREFESLPKVSAKQPPARAKSDTGAVPAGLSLQAREALAMQRLAALQEKQHRERTADNVPDEWWHVAIAYLGLPIEYNYTPLKHRPWVTWLLAGVIAAISILAFRNLEAVVADWGMIPAQMTRRYGLTLITSFFLHGGVTHLVGNLYFLWVFGDNTEDVLGKGRYLLLILLATLAGDLAHILSRPDSMIPTIGASGGISGILAYYCLRFPKATMGVVYWWHWLRIPVWTMLFIWTLLQILNAYLQRLGVSNVAAFAHLGGAGIGVLFWWLTRQSFTKAPETT